MDQILFVRSWRSSPINLKGDGMSMLSLQLVSAAPKWPKITIIIFLDLILTERRWKNGEQRV